MSIFDVIKHHPVPEPLTAFWLDSLPSMVYLNYRLWLRKENNYSGIGHQARKEKLLELLLEHNMKEPYHGNQSSKS